jgi:hypothetical protein
MLPKEFVSVPQLYPPKGINNKIVLMQPFKKNLDLSLAGDQHRS